MQTVNSLQRRNTFKVRCVPAPLETTEIKSFSDLGLGKVPASLHDSPADNDDDGDYDNRPLTCPPPCSSKSPVKGDFFSNNSLIMTMMMNLLNLQDMLATLWTQADAHH